MLGSFAGALLLLLSRFSCVRLCDPIDGSWPGSPVPGILQARTLEWVALSFSNAWKWKVKVKSRSCPTLSDPMDCSLPGSSIHGIFQARVLEWGAIAFSVAGVIDTEKLHISIYRYWNWGLGVKNTCLSIVVSIGLINHLALCMAYKYLIFGII